jgi:hypothetical protein
LLAWPAIGIPVNERLVFKRNSKNTFAPGFRLSVLDVTILALGATVALALATAVWWYGFVVGFALGHFFLFCNVVRMARSLELAWAVVFVVLAAATVALDTPGWQVTVLVSFVATVVVVVVQMRRPSYHGLGWQWINPELPKWWKSWESDAQHRR